MSWFEKLVGFPERSPEFVREQLTLEGQYLKPKSNSRKFKFGTLTTPDLKDLREQAAGAVAALPTKTNSISELVADVGNLHQLQENHGALFQVASQFNLLEMASPELTPEDGVGIYQNDWTQGPTCAIAAGAGTIYRNYFVPVGDQIGQSASQQIDCIGPLGKALGNEQHSLWKMQNGYVMITRDGLKKINHRLDEANPAEIDRLRGLLQIGIQWETAVTLQTVEGIEVTQTYCSALPVAYNSQPTADWEPLARLILEAAYEATLAAGILNLKNTGNPRIFLTLLGGGVFGNKLEWILDSIGRAFKAIPPVGLEIAVVSYRQSNKSITQLTTELGR